MADITHNQTGTQKRSSQGIIAGKGDSLNVKSLQATVELAVATVGYTVDFGQIPTGARILGASKVYFDDLATTGAPLLDLGLGSVDSNITSDPDALSDGHTLATADPDGAMLLGDIDRIGVPAWDLVNGVTEDPKGSFEVYGSITDAATTQVGTITVEVLYTVD